MDILKKQKDISSLNGQLVDITEISDLTYKANPADEHCREFRYVKIKTKDAEGYVDGRKVYGLTKDAQIKILKPTITKFPLHRQLILVLAFRMTITDGLSD